MGKYIVPEKVERFYNVACTGWSTMASTEKGFYGYGNLKGTLVSENHQEIVKLNEITPDRVKFVYCNYSNYFIVENDGSLHTDSNIGNRVADFEKICYGGGSLPFCWSLENHHSFPKT